MFVIETFEAGCQPRHQPTAPLVAIRIDTECGRHITTRIIKRVPQTINGVVLMRSSCAASMVLCRSLSSVVSNNVLSSANAFGSSQTSPAGSFPGGFRTTAPVQAEPSPWAVIRNPSQLLTLAANRPMAWPKAAQKLEQWQSPISGSRRRLIESSSSRGLHRPGSTGALCAGSRRTPKTAPDVRRRRASPHREWPGAREIQRSSARPGTTADADAR